MQHILILAGGSGTRLWPLSHQGEPKQLLELIDGVSLLRMAYERVAGLVPDANILVCTGSSYADTVAKLLPEVPAENILGEPVGRDSSAPWHGRRELSPTATPMASWLSSQLTTLFVLSMIFGPPSSTVLISPILTPPL